MAAGAYFCIIVYSLFFQYAFDHKTKESKVGKTNNRDKVGLVYADYVSDLTLDGWNNATTQYHHDQKC